MGFFICADTIILSLLLNSALKADSYPSLKKPFTASQQYSKTETIFRLVILFIVFLVFLSALELIMNAAKQLGTGLTQYLFTLTFNPIISIFIGVLLTAVLQSSSTITSGMVALVASGTVSLENAVPVVIGANIGTTLTATMVSFANFSSKKEFCKGFVTACEHAFFNLLTALILVPIEWQFGLLSKLASSLSGIISGAIGEETWTRFLFSGLVRPFTLMLDEYMLTQPWLILGASVFTLFVSIQVFTGILKGLVITPKWEKRKAAMFDNPYKAMITGIGLTAAIHSSSVVTSLVTMLAASNKIAARKVFPILLGANLGTTFTAFFASISRSEAAIALALTHVFFNLFGVLLFAPFSPLKDIPVYLSKRLASLTVSNRLYALVYLLSLYFVLPFLVIYLLEI